MQDLEVYRDHGGNHFVLRQSIRRQGNSCPLALSRGVSRPSGQKGPVVSFAVPWLSKSRKKGEDM